MDFSRDSFLGQLVVTLSGLSVAQLLPILAAPLLARCFDAEQFGNFAVFYGLSAITAIAFTGKMDAAVVATREDAAAHQAVVVGVSLSVLGWLLGTLITIVLPLAWIKFLVPNRWFVYLLLFTAFIQALFYLFISVLLRYKDFEGIAYARVGRTLVVLGSTFFFFFAGYVDQALIYGVVLGQLIALLGLLYRLIPQPSLRQWLRMPSEKQQLLDWFSAQSRFLWFSTPAAVLNSTTFYLPVFFLSTFVGEAAAGYFGFVQRTVGVPVGVVASSLADVYRKKIAELYAFNRPAVLELLTKNIRRTLLGLLPLLLLAYPLVQPLVPFFFGQEWLPIIPIIYLFLPVYVASILVSPFSTILHVIGQQRYELFINLIYLFLGSLALSLGIFWLGDWLQALGLFALAMLLTYGLMLLGCYVLLNRKTA